MGKQVQPFDENTLNHKSFIQVEFEEGATLIFNRTYFI